ncbi:MAG: hypothetical protein KAT65_04280 [Methanophagales archaeon]|nr:hypothetical protein [Methanophagales archaeon]
MALTLYKHHLGVTGWAGVEDSLDELGRIRKTTLDFGGESRDKISVLTKEQKVIIEKLGFSDALILTTSTHMKQRRAILYLQREHTLKYDTQKYVCKQGTGP